MSQLSSGWDDFWACLGGAIQDELKDRIGLWRLNLNDAYIATPFVDDITNKINNARQLLCINETMNQEVASYRTGLQGLLAPIQTCLQQFYSFEGALLFNEITDYIAELLGYEGDLTALIGDLNNQIADLEDQRDRLIGRASLAFQVWQQDNPAYFAKYTTDREEYVEGEAIEFEIETPLETSELTAWTVVTSVDPPTMEEIPDTSIQGSDRGTRFKVYAQVPEDINQFSVKFQLLAERSDACVFFVYFDVKSTTKPTGGKRRYVVRPCPPV